MIFQFEHLGLWDVEINESIDIASFKRILTDWQDSLEGIGWNALFMENHDQPRSVSVWGDDGVYLKESAKALAAVYFLMKGTPFIYQGQELGMTNVAFPSIEDYDDVAMKRLYEIETAKGASHEDVMKIVWKKEGTIHERRCNGMLILTPDFLRPNRGSESMRITNG